jgi:hypothetical protein
VLSSLSVFSIKWHCPYCRGICSCITCKQIQSLATVSLSLSTPQLPVVRGHVTLIENDETKRGVTLHPARVASTPAPSLLTSSLPMPISWATLSSALSPPPTPTPPIPTTPSNLFKALVKEDHVHASDVNDDTSRDHSSHQKDDHHGAAIGVAQSVDGHYRSAATTAPLPAPRTFNNPTIVINDGPPPPTTICSRRQNGCVARHGSIGWRHMIWPSNDRSVEEKHHHAICMVNFFCSLLLLLIMPHIYGYEHLRFNGFAIDFVAGIVSALDEGNEGSIQMNNATPSNIWLSLSFFKRLMIDACNIHVSASSSSPSRVIYITIQWIMLLLLLLMMMMNE